jgi:hypothetical protein
MYFAPAPLAPLPAKQLPPTKQHNDAIAYSAGLTKAYKTKNGDTHIIGNRFYIAGNHTTIYA